MGSGDRYYGYGPISATCTAVITQLFDPAAAPPPPAARTDKSGLLNAHGYPSPPPSADSSPQMGSDAAEKAPAWPREGIDTPPQSPVVNETAKNIPELMDFIAYALYRTRLPTPIIHSALVLLARLKKLYPSARGTSSSPHRLFLSALMLASKMSMDDTYSNRSWCIVGQQLFTLPEVNRMERELFGFLNWNCCVSGAELDAWLAEWLSPGGIVGDSAAAEASVAAHALAARRSSEERKRRRSSASAPAAQPTSPQSSQAAKPSTSPLAPGGERSDRHRQATDAARALLRRSASTDPHPAVAGSTEPSSAPAVRRGSVPTLPCPSSRATFEWSAPPSPHSPTRTRFSSQPRWTSSFTGSTTAKAKPDGPSSSRPDPMHMRQSSDASMRSISSSDLSSSTGSTSGAVPPSMCCSSVGSPYIGSDSPASNSSPRTPDAFDAADDDDDAVSEVKDQAEDEAEEEPRCYDEGFRHVKVDRHRRAVGGTAW